MSQIEHDEIGDVFAERVLEATRNGNQYQVTVRIGRPVKSRDASHYRCPYQIAGLGDDTVRSAAGEDSMQSLNLALKIIGSELSRHCQSYRFSWLGQPDLGFPRPK